jgi:hypothetical protein
MFAALESDGPEKTLALQVLSHDRGALLLSMAKFVCSDGIRKTFPPTDSDNTIKVSGVPSVAQLTLPNMGSSKHAATTDTVRVLIKVSLAPGVSAKVSQGARASREP